MKQINLFAEETQLERLSKLGDSLERLKVIDFESFRPILTEGMKKERKSSAGRHPFDHVMMFKVDQRPQLDSPFAGKSYDILRPFQHHSHHLIGGFTGCVHLYLLFKTLGLCPKPCLKTS